MRRLAFVLGLGATMASCQWLDGDDDAKDEARDDGGAAADGPEGGPAKEKTRCDPTRLASLVATMRSASRRDQRALVRAHLAGACELSPPLRDFMRQHGGTLPAGADADAPRGADAGAQKGGADADPPPNAAAVDLEAELCKGADLDAVGKGKSPPDRLRAIFDACDLAEAKLLSRGAFVRGGVDSLAPWYALDWLQAQGASEADAKLVARSLFDAARPAVARPGQTLPRAAHGLPPAPPGPRIFVSPTEIRYGADTTIALAAEGRAPADVRRGHVVAPLLEALGGAQGRGADRGHAVVVLDRATKFSALVDVVYTVNRAGYRKVALLAETPTLDVGALVVTPPPQAKGRRAAKDASGTRLKVYVMAEEGLRTSVAGKPAFSVYPRWDGVLDLDSLAARASAHRERVGDTPAVISAEDSIEAQEILRIAETLRGPGCDAGGECRLSSVVVRASATGE